jgi:hypothetical protein
MPKPYRHLSLSAKTGNHEPKPLTSPGIRSRPVPATRTPVSVVLTSAQLAWLDRLTEDGALSRSAAIRLVLQQAMEQDTTQARRRRHGLSAR